MDRLKLSVSLSDCDNILVRGVNWIGDAVMTMPALRALRLSNRTSRITLLVKPWVAPLFEKDPNIDEIMLYSDEYEGILGRIDLSKKLRRHNFGAALLLQNAFDAAVITTLAGIPERIGYGRDMRGFLLTKAVPFDDRTKRLHHVDYYLNLLAMAGLHVTKSLPWIYLQLEERLGAREMLRDLKRPVVAINPGATYGSSKRWHPQKFAEVAMRVINDLDGSVLVLGGPEETAIADEICKAVSGSVSRLSYLERVLSVAGKTNLRELAALISGCDLLVTNDSGPMHIGYAVGTPLVAVFGSTSADHTGPVGEGNRVVKKDIECAPCYERTCRRGDLNCMDLITADEVFESIKSLISPRRAVFFDRDGTLCRDAHFLSKMEDLEIFRGVEGLKKLREEGFSLIGVSNQSGVARGLVDEEFVRKVNRLFMDSYGFDDFYYCPHHPDDHCSCRKPEPGLLYRARAEHKVDLGVSYVVGDKEADLLLARSVGARGILVKTGKDVSSAYADFVAEDLEEATRFILGKSGA
jgi:heptosyltransferase-2